MCVNVVCIIKLRLGHVCELSLYTSRAARYAAEAKPASLIRFPMLSSLNRMCSLTIECVLLAKSARPSYIYCICIQHIHMYSKTCAKVCALHSIFVQWNAFFSK